MKDNRVGYLRKLILDLIEAFGSTEDVIGDLLIRMKEIVLKRCQQDFLSQTFKAYQNDLQPVPVAGRQLIQAVFFPEQSGGSFCRIKQTDPWRDDRLVGEGATS